MEDVLEVDHRPSDLQRPVVCVDEASKQLIAEVRDPLPPQPGQVAKYDSEYERSARGQPVDGRGTAGRKTVGASHRSPHEDRLGEIHPPAC